MVGGRPPEAALVAGDVVPRRPRVLGDYRAMGSHNGAACAFVVDAHTAHRTTATHPSREKKLLVSGRAVVHIQSPQRRDGYSYTTREEGGAFSPA